MSVVPILASKSNDDTPSVGKARRGSLLLWALVALGLLLLACGNGDESIGQDSPPAAPEDGAANSLEDVAPVEVDYQPVPTVEIQAVINTTSGVDVKVATTGFTVNPSRTSTVPIDGEGHFLLYVDGVGRRRVYQHTFHVEISEPGDHEVRIALAANDQAPLTVGGQPIEAVATVTVPEPYAHFEPTLGDGDHKMEVVTPS